MDYTHKLCQFIKKKTDLEGSPVPGILSPACLLHSIGRPVVP